jgi:hypothetical protein
VELDMNEQLLEKIIDEIDAMTPEEYWSLFEESQQLPDFVPV